MRKANIVLGALVITAFPGLVYAAPRTFQELANLIVSILDMGTGLLILAGIVIYFWGISTNILKMKDEGGQAFKAYVIWGLIALFIMVSIWGIIEILQNTLFGGDYYDPNSGTSSGFQGTGNGNSGFPQFSE